MSTLARFRLVPPRRNDPELMDGSDQTAEEMAAALRDIRAVNRWLGGFSGIVRPLAALARERHWRDLSLLDIGTGSADIPRRVLAEATSQTGVTRAAGVDLHPIITRIARAEGDGVSVLRADGFRLPFRDGAFDIVTASMFLHHFEETPAAALVREFARVARRCVLVNDLQRHRVPWLVIHALGAVGGASRMFRHDAPLSVLRGFTAEELLHIGRATGVPAASVSVVRQAPWRLVLRLDREAA